MEAKKQVLEAILGLISPLFLAQNGPDIPKLCTVALASNTQYLGEPLGAILGVTRAILELFGGPIKFLFGYYGDNFTPFGRLKGPRSI